MKYDEEGRKIDFGMQVGMSLEGMNVADLESYISQLKFELERTKLEKESL
mgnify:CR=1 FL=1